MPTEITFDNPPAGFFSSYAEDGFNFTTQQAVSLQLPDVLWNGAPKMPEGSGGYLSNEYSQDTVLVQYAAGANTFGALSLDLDGYQNTNQFDAQGNIIRLPINVTFTFTGTRADFTEVSYTVTTDASLGWQHITLPADFATGLTKLTWTTTNPTTAAWGAFDNVSLVVDSGTAPPPPPPPADPGTTNHAPVAVDDAATVKVHDAILINVVANDTDADGDSLGVAKFGPSLGALQGGLTSTSALGATVSFQSGQILYTANAATYSNLGIGQTATDTFYYTTTDTSGATSTAKVTVTINNPDHAPTLVADTAAVANDQSVTVNVLANDTDQDAGDTLTLSGIGAAAGSATQTTGVSALGSSVSIVGGKLVYNANAAVFDTLAPGTTKVDTVYYTVTDSHGLSSVSSVAVTVTIPSAVNHAPTAGNDTATVANNGTVTINVLANDRDSDGDALTLAGFGKTAAGANTYHTTGTSALGADVSIVDGKLVYDADASSFDKLSSGQSVTDTIYYTVTDSRGASSVASVSVTVTGSSNSSGGGDCDDGHGHGNGSGDQTGKEIDGTSHADTLTGTSKAEVIHGNDGADKILAGGGADTLDGGAGNDTLTGGDGGDTFVFGANFGKDVILDFQGGHYDDGAHDNRDGDKNDNNGHANHDGHDDDRDWRDGGNSGYGYGNGYGNDHDDRHGPGAGQNDDPVWVAGDVVKISTAEFRNYADLLAHAKQTAQGVLFTTTDGHDSLLLQGASLSSLHSQDFLFG